MIFHQFWWHFQWVKCHQFLWFFLEIFVDLLNWWHFRHTKTHQFLQITKIFTKIGEKFAENSKENSNHQHFHKKLWKFWHIWDHIDFLQNCHQFWWFPWIFANFGDFFIEIFSDSLKFSLFLVNNFSPILVRFSLSKMSPILVTFL